MLSRGSAAGDDFSDESKAMHRTGPNPVETFGADDRDNRSSLAGHREGDHFTGAQTMCRERDGSFSEAQRGRGGEGEGNRESDRSRGAKTQDREGGGHSSEAQRGMMGGQQRRDDDVSGQRGGRAGKGTWLGFQGARAHSRRFSPMPPLDISEYLASVGGPRCALMPKHLWLSVEGHGVAYLVDMLEPYSNGTFGTVAPFDAVACMNKLKKSSFDARDGCTKDRLQVCLLLRCSDSQVPTHFLISEGFPRCFCLVVLSRT